MTIVHYAAFAFFPLVMAYAAVSDLLSLTISNKVSLIGVAGFIVAAPLLGMDIATIGMHLAAGLLVLVGGFALFAFRWIGGGDAKIAATAALWLGYDQTLAFLVQSALFGGALTIAILYARRMQLPAIAVRSWVLRLHDPASGVPYGIALAAGALVIYPKTIWIGLMLT